MTQSSPERKPCGTCGKECTITAKGGVRHHLTENPDFQAGPDSRTCKGVGQPPAGPAGVALAEDMEADQAQHQCRLCKHPVTLTGNGRARSHLTPEATPRPCPGGSDFPLGTYPDIVGTTDGIVATLAAERDHVPVGQCYGCYGEAGNPISDAELESMAEAGGTGTAPWGYAAETEARPTMADQLKAVETDDFGRPAVRECFNCDTVGCPGCGEPPADDGRPQAEQFRAAVEAPTGGPLLRARMSALLTDHRTPEQKARDARTSELTREAIKVLQQRTPEQKAETAARMDRVASQALGVPLDPTLNHKYTDPSGVVWVHEGPESSCQSLDCRIARNCEQCDTDTHRCPGCGESVPHGVVACDDCERALLARKLPAGTTEDGRRCEHPEGLFGFENGQFVCIACGTPCTHPDGFKGTADDVDEDGQDRVVSVCELCGAMDPEDELPDDDSRDQATVQTAIGLLPADPDEWRTPDDLLARMPEDVQGLDSLRLNCGECGHAVTPLVDYFGPDGRAARVVWDCQPSIESDHSGGCRSHECKPDTQARLGDLDEGDCFVRRGAFMRLTEKESASSVLAVVVGGPYDGRTGELKNLDEIVERAPEPPTKEQETKECPDDKTATQQPRSSAAARPPTTAAPAPGSPRATLASAPAVSPKSKSVTPSAPTAKAAGNSRGAAMTTDQSAAAAAFLGSGRGTTSAPAGAAQTPGQFLAGAGGSHGEKETDRDHWGRYLILHPDTGKEKAWTRATTFAKSISDTYALSQWGLRMALLGATMRPDIVQRAHGKHVKADKKLLDELTADLKNAAGDKVAANLGTSMHSFTEMADRAWHSPGGPRSVMDQVPPDCRDMVETYIRLLEETGLEPVADLIEFTTLVKQYGVAGTSDNCYKVTRPLTLKIGRAEVLLNPGEYVIGDKKTGKDLDYGWQEIAIQLAVYAQGLSTVGRWDRREKKWYPKPLGDAKVRLDAGVVLHLPVDKESEKTPTVYGVDLESGWSAAVLCERVRAWRNVRNLASPVMVSEAETFAPARPAAAPAPVTTRTTVRPASLKDRANAVTSKGEASAVWQEARKQGLSESETDELVKIMQVRLKKLAEPGG